MNIAAYHPRAPIEAHKVPDDARIHTLPHHFGRHMLAVHDAVYRWMRRLAPEYSGGILALPRALERGLLHGPGVRALTASSRG